MRFIRHDAANCLMYPEGIMELSIAEVQIKFYARPDLFYTTCIVS